jgi:GNAT superfamily N-acetyltransferase
MSTDRVAQVRKLIAADIGSAVELSSEAGWNQTAKDWRLLIELAPECCLAVEIDGEIAATATLVAYAQKLAWIGMVLTRVKYRGRGFATRLLREALHLADANNVESVKLDATDQGQPLYEKLGFRTEQPVERWACDRLTLPNALTSATGRELTPSLLAVDESAFGANRSILLQKLTRLTAPAVLDNSCALTRSGRIARYLGPCVAETEQKAAAVLASVLAEHSGQNCYWDLLPSNRNAIALAKEFGFNPARRLTRMVRGSDLRSNNQLIYALSGFELG